MALVANRAAVAGPHGPLLLPTSLVAEPGTVCFVTGDPGPSSTALALVLGGRLALDEGEVHLGHDPDDALRRRSVALVDVPNITEPEPSLPVGVVVGEELALAGLPSHSSDIDAFLREREAAALSPTRWETLPPAVAIGWLLDIARRREGISTVVLTSPDRWGGNPADWYAVARQLADEGLIVVIVATHSSARLLGPTDVYEVGVA